MDRIDIIDSAGKGYQFLWRNRVYLARLAAIPLTIVLCCYQVVVFFDLDGNLLRQGLLALPGLFAQGWMLSHVVRQIFYNERFPYYHDQPGQAAAEFLHQRRLNLRAGLAAFVLAQVVIVGLQAAAFQMIEGVPSPGVEQSAVPTGDHPAGDGVADVAPVAAVPGAAAPEAAPAMPGPGGGVMVMLLILLFWGFRFVWAYIPLSAGLPLTGYISRTAPVALWLQMIGVWLVCHVPVLTLFLLLRDAIAGPAIGSDSLPVATEFFLVALQGMFEVVINILCTAALSYALIGLYARVDRQV